MGETKTTPLTRAEELEKEILSRREQLRALRAEIAAGPVSDYSFERPDGTSVKLSQLFGKHDDLLIVHNMGESCQYCALWADGFIGLTRHLVQRCAFVLASGDSPESLTKQIALRGWNFPVVCDRATTFNKDMAFEQAPGSRLPGVSSFHRAPDGSIARVSSAPFGTGDEFCSLWPLFELFEDKHKNWAPTPPQISASTQSP